MTIFKIFDLDLNFINSLTIEYKKTFDIKFSQISKNSKINEFIKCYKYYGNTNFYYLECQIIKYENKNLSILQTFEVYPYKNDYIYSIYSYKLNIFDENKIGFFIYDTNRHGEYDFINIFQYENQKISNYKNFRSITIPSLKFQDEYGYICFSNTEQGIGMFSSYNKDQLF